MTEQPVSEWHAAVVREYQQAVKDLQANGGTSRKEAFLLAQSRLAHLVEVGEVQFDPAEAIRHQLYRADEEQGKHADAMIKRIADGQALLDLGGDPLMDVVVTLGEGRRKTWAKVSEADLREMDALRYRNFRAQADAYDRWRKGFERAVAAIHGHATLADAVAAGAFVAEPGSAA